MNIKTAISAALLFGSVAITNAQTLVLGYDFNDAASSASAAAVSGASVSTAMTLSNGAVIGANGSGADGASGNRAYVNSGAPFTASEDNGQVSLPLSTVGSFTLSFWYKANGNPVGGWNIASYNANNGILMQGTATSNTLGVNVDGGSGANLATGQTLNGNWIFLALTYDGTLATNHLKLYTGTTSATATLAAQQSYGVGDVSFPATTFYLGNNSALNRPSPGSYDGLRFYTGASASGAGALNLSSIQGLQTQTIPEPATWALLAISMTTVMVLRRRRSA